MSLPHILLGLLAEPASGYDLKKAFGMSVRHFWSAELSQIYPTLKRMEKQGLLRSEPETSAKGPNRKVYHRTPAGREALVEWVSAGPADGQERLSFVAQVFFLAAVPHEDRVAFLEGLRDAFRARVVELEEVERNWRAADPRYPDALPDEEFFPHITLRLGLAKYVAIIAWCDECLSRLRGRAVAAPALD
jgi:DNA-binding PadR family transcriptional regulator